MQKNNEIRAEQRRIFDEIESYTAGDISVVSSVRKRQYTPAKKHGLKRVFSAETVKSLLSAAFGFRARRKIKLEN